MIKKIGKNPRGWKYYFFQLWEIPFLFRRKIRAESFGPGMVSKMLIGIYAKFEVKMAFYYDTV